MTGAESFNREIGEFFKADVPEAARKFATGLGLHGLKRSVELSPVLDGPYRGSWQINTGAPVGGDAGPGGPSAEEALSAGEAALANVPPYTTIYLATNAPQATTIEYGGYPSPVKRGTRIRQAYLRARRSKGIKSGALPVGTDPSYEIRSAGGFSKQAPQGVISVVITELELQDYFEG